MSNNIILTNNSITTNTTLDLAKENECKKSNIKNIKSNIIKELGGLSERLKEFNESKRIVIIYF